MIRNLIKIIITALFCMFLLVSCKSEENNNTENTRNGEPVIEKIYDTAAEGSTINARLDGGFSIK